MKCVYVSCFLTATNESQKQLTASSPLARRRIPTAWRRPVARRPVALPATIAAGLEATAPLGRAAVVAAATRRPVALPATIAAGLEATAPLGRAAVVAAAARRPTVPA